MRRCLADGAILTKLVWAAAVASGAMGGCECSRRPGEEAGPEIHRKSIAEQNPQAPRPAVVFPDHCRQADEDVNRFIEHALTVCSEGDYDAFRQLFGTAYDPTSEPDFNRIWQGVKQVVVLLVMPSAEDPPRYYALAKVTLWNPDARGRTQRNAPLMIFQEAGQWRLGPAPKEIVERLRGAGSQPASRTGE